MVLAIYSTTNKLLYKDATMEYLSDIYSSLLKSYNYNPQYIVEELGYQSSLNKQTMDEHVLDA